MAMISRSVLAGLFGSVVLAPASALADPDGVRVLTYNVAFLYAEAENPHVAPIAPQCTTCDPLEVPPSGPLGVPCECFPSMALYPNWGRFAEMDEVERADALADRILATDQDVVVLNEVFNPHVRAHLTMRLGIVGPYQNYISRLRGHPVVEGQTLGDLAKTQAPEWLYLFHWLPDLPDFMDYQAVPADSGLMVFSKLPFEKLSGDAISDDTACGEDVCEVSGWNDGAPIDPGYFAFRVFDACEEMDCWSSKGVGLVKVATTPLETHIAFTHMQADYPSNGQYFSDVRAKQLDEIRQTIVGAIAEPDMGDAFVVLAGDLNVIGSDVVDPTVGAKEWHEVFDPASTSPVVAEDFFSCGNGVDVGGSVEPCRFGQNGKAMLSDPVGFRHSPTDEFITNDADDARLDYLAHSHGGGRICPQHTHIAWDLMADVDGGKAWLSDHLPVRGDFAAAADHCSPSDDPELFRPQHNVHMLNFGGTNCAPTGPNPQCHQDEIVNPPHATIANGGGMQWFRIDQAGSYSIGLNPANDDERVTFDVYHHTDLSRALAPFDTVKNDWGVPYSFPDPPYYIRTFAVNENFVPDRSATERDYTLNVHQHLCRDPIDACFIDPGLALTTPYEYIWPATVDFLSDVRDLYFRFKTSSVAHGEPVPKGAADARYPSVDFLLEGAGSTAHECMKQKEPVVQDWDDPTFPSVLLDEWEFVDVLVEPNTGSWDEDAYPDERWVAIDLPGKVQGELAQYFVRITRAADHTNAFNECNSGLTSTLAYDTDLSYFAPHKLETWNTFFGAWDVFLVHSGFDASGYQSHPPVFGSALVSTEEPDDGSAIRWLSGRPELRGYYVDALWPTLWETLAEDYPESESLNLNGGHSSLHPLLPSEDAPNFIRYTDNPNPENAEYLYYYWAATCHFETDPACKAP